MVTGKPDASRLAAWAAISTGAGVTVVNAGIPLFRAITGVGPAALPTSVQLSVVITCLTVLIGYVYSRLERSSDDVRELLDRPAVGTYVYRTTASFLDALADATVGASQVMTVNSSVARGALPELDRYFRRTSRFWGSRAAAGGSFRSVAYVESHAKARWLAERAYESRGEPATSFAVVRQRALGESATLCFHLVHKQNSYMSFLYPSPDVTGSMQGLCVYGQETYDVLLHLFDRMWDGADLLSSGKVLRKEGFERLSLLSPEVVGAPSFAAAMVLAQ
jgi:hypothetical protein